MSHKHLLSARLLSPALSAPQSSKHWRISGEDPFARLLLLGGLGLRIRFRETGLLCFEALIDSNLTVEAVKPVADRARPLQDNGHGGFESASSRLNSSFPSGHSINTWAMASVIAHQYPHPRIVPIVAYALATTVVVSRVGARQHFRLSRRQQYQ